VAALDLRATIQEGLQANPAPEEMPIEDVRLEKNAPSGHGNSGPNEDPREEMDFSKDQNMLERIGQDWRDHMSDTGGIRQSTSEEEERRQHFYDSLTTETSLQQHLMQLADVVLGQAQIGPGLEHEVHGFGIAGHFLLVARTEGLEGDRPREQVLDLGVRQLRSLDARG
jgi:RNA polymerase sigma-54 factor